MKTQYSSEEISRVQSRIDETAARILSDHDFASRYREDPVGTLKGQDLPDEAITSLLEQARGEDEVSGYMAPIWHWNGRDPGPFDPGPFNPDMPSDPNAGSNF